MPAEYTYGGLREKLLRIFDHWDFALNFRETMILQDFEVFLDRRIVAKY